MEDLEPGKKFVFCTMKKESVEPRCLQASETSSGKLQKSDLLERDQ
jgi:hypothetical protein